ncbi:MAG: CRISPR-associated endonuclease Cas1, partial [Planctomycetota bacterium]
ADTIEGRWRHRRVDQETGDLPSSTTATDSQPPGGAAASADATMGDSTAPDALHARSVLLSAAEAGLIARIDLIEGDGRHVTPVDYKRGSVPDHLPERAWEADRVQLAAQAVVLRENGFTCNEGVIYYAASKTRVSVAIDETLVRRTLEARDGARALAAAGQIPPPLADSPKCPGCSLVGICLPDEVRSLAAADADAAPEVRRLVPARRDALPVYVQAQGGSVGKTGDQLYVVAKDQPRQTLRLLDVAQLNLFGNVQVSTQAVHELADRGIPICYFSYGGWFNAITTGLTHKNVELRMRQFTAAADPARALTLARAFIAGKVRNCRTLLRRNCAARPRAALRDLNDLRQRIPLAQSAASLLGLEGNAARVYFQQFGGMLKPASEALPVFDFTTRNRRPPRDPVNALLSLAYALLVKDLTVTLLAVGFDPFLGFYHRPRYGRPALALDLAEEFRPIVADSVVIQVVNTGELRPADFITRGDACALKPAGRRTFIAAFERRLDTLIRHPIFGYTISYRRVLEVQARLMAAHLLGELPGYTAFATR